MSRLRIVLIMLSSAAVVAALSFGFGPAGADEEARSSRTAYGLTDDQRIVTFQAHSPRSASGGPSVTGLVTDTSLVAIDVRPENGVLVGLGNASGVYSIDPATGAATLLSRATVALSGASFGADFNPTVDRLRVVSNTGQNLRINVDTGATTTDTALTYTPPTAATGVTAAAYTNNDKLAVTDTGTVLYDLDTSLDQLVIQAPPNNGQLNRVGAARRDLPAVLGFDIATLLTDGRSLFNTGYVVTGASLLRINLDTGAVHSVGTFRAGIVVVDIAVAT